MRLLLCTAAPPRRWHAPAPPAVGRGPPAGCPAPSPPAQCDAVDFLPFSSSIRLPVPAGHETSTVERFSTVPAPAAHLSAQLPVLAPCMLSQQRALGPAVGLQGRVQDLLLRLVSGDLGAGRGERVRQRLGADAAHRHPSTAPLLALHLPSRLPLATLACRWKSRASAPADSFSISRSAEASEPAAVASSAAAAALKKCANSVSVLRWSCGWGWGGIRRGRLCMHGLTACRRQMPVRPGRRQQRSGRQGSKVSRSRMPGQGMTHTEHHLAERGRLQGWHHPHVCHLLCLRGVAVSGWLLWAVVAAAATPAAPVGICLPTPQPNHLLRCHVAGLAGAGSPQDLS